MAIMKSNDNVKIIMKIMNEEMKIGNDNNK